MSLASPALTTTSVKARKKTITKAQQAELERGWWERNVRLRNMGLPKETLEQYTEWVYGRGKKATRAKDTARETSKAPAQKTSAPSALLEEAGRREVPTKKIWVTGACTVKQTPAYTGTKIIGIGTMHKSNAVPIFSNEEAKDISSMRR